MSRINNCLISLSICLLVGCTTNQKIETVFPNRVPSNPSFSETYLESSEPELHPADQAIVNEDLSPLQLNDYYNLQYVPITLDECIRRALDSSKVFRELGGAIVRSPASISSVYDPASTYTDPQFGEEAALSAFDANFESGLFFDNNDRAFNNNFTGDENGFLVQDLGQFNLEFNKLAATGTLFSARSLTTFDSSSQLGQIYPSSWEQIFELGFRHPLLQGSGSLFNRIAGPSQTPGVYNGVLIARTNSELSLADFEAGVRRLVSDVENAYWDLYYAYRELEAQTDARDAALAVFENQKALSEPGASRISALPRVGAEEQYLRFETAIIDSIEGRLNAGTQSNSGSSGGVFRSNSGVRVAERRLRYLTGMSITDGALLEPMTQPFQAAILFDWLEARYSAVNRRPETKRQRWVIKQRELELTASKNFLLPRLDLVGGYRVRGLGSDLAGGGRNLTEDINDQIGSSAFETLSTGDFQEFQFGIEYNRSIGFRQGHAAVRSAELRLQREKAVYQEQKRKLALDLSNVFAETQRAYAAKSLAKQRFDKAVEYRRLAADAIDRNRSQVDVLLEAQRRVLEAQLQYVSAEVEYALAIKNTHFEKGTYLQQRGVLLAEEQSNPKASQDAELRRSKRFEELNYVVRDPIIASGQQHSLSGGEIAGANISDFPQQVFAHHPNPIQAPVQMPLQGQVAPEFQQNVLPVETLESPGIPLTQASATSLLIGDVAPKAVATTGITAKALLQDLRTKSGGGNVETPAFENLSNLGNSQRQLLPTLSEFDSTRRGTMLPNFAEVQSTEPNWSANRSQAVQANLSDAAVAEPSWNANRPSTLRTSDNRGEWTPLR